MSRPVRCVLVALASLSVLPVAEAAAQRGGDVVPGRYIVVYDRSVAQPEQETEQREQDLGFKSSRKYRRAVEGFAAKLSDQQVDRLQADPEVDAVVPDRRVQASDQQLAPSDAAPSGVQRMGAFGGGLVNSAATTGVAVIDTGIDLDHPDLTVGRTDTGAIAGIDCTGTGSPDDDNGHGTHVAGSIGANNNGAGVVGVAPGTRVHPVKVLNGQGSGTTSQVVCGIDWVAANAGALGIEVANMSLGGGGPRLATCSTTTDPEHRAICNATALGVTFVVAAGNDGWDFDYAAQPDVPAVYPEVLTVTAVSDSDGKGGATGGAPACRTGEGDDRYASFSNFATTSTAIAHTIAGPGVCIRSTWPGGGYSTISGTSMATPHVAGAVALCHGEVGSTSAPCAGLTPAGVINHMRSQADGATRSNTVFGFNGDPLRPVTGRYYGFMTPAAVGATTTEPTPTPPPPTTVQENVAPGSVARVSGTLSGSAAGLATASDGSTVRVDSTTSGTRTSAFDATYSGVPRDLSDLRLSFRGASTRQCSNTISLFDTGTGTWATVDSRSLSSTISVTTAALSNPARFVDASGQVRARVRCQLGNRSFSTTTDLLRIAFKRPA